MALRALDDVKESVRYVFWVSSMIKGSNSQPSMTTCQVSHLPLTPYVMPTLVCSTCPPFYTS